MFTSSKFFEILLILAGQRRRRACGGFFVVIGLAVNDRRSPSLGAGRQRVQAVLERLEHALDRRGQRDRDEG